MALYKFSDKIVFNILTDIKVGYIEITNYQGKVFRFGNSQDDLKAKLKIINPNFSYVFNERFTIFLSYYEEIPLKIVNKIEVSCLRQIFILSSKN